MELGLGYLRWTPDTFWRATLRELVAGMDGLTVAKGGKSPRTQAETIRDLRKLIGDDVPAPKTPLKFQVG